MHKLKDRKIKAIVNSLLLVFFLLFSCSENPIAVNYYHQEPEDVSFISTDIIHFWQAYDSITASQSPDSLTILRNLYFNLATAGLVDYCKMKSLNESVLCKTVFNNCPKFYKSIHKNIEHFYSTQTVDQIKGYLKNFNDLIQDAKFADVYYIIGNLSAGGKASSHGIILSLEFFCTDSTTDFSEISQNARTLLLSMQGPDVFPSLVIHELVHVNQIKINPGSLLLNQAIIEGAADFITWKTTGTHLNSLAYQYGITHEKGLWEEFKADMKKDLYSQNIKYKWMYNSDNYPTDKAPDLAYFIGYRICESYFENQTDKMVGMRNILQVSDYEQFLEDSQYDLKPKM
jgi:hypothetical protein